MGQHRTAATTRDPARAGPRGDNPRQPDAALLGDVARAIGGSVFVSDWARETARRFGVGYEPVPADAFAGPVSRLSEAEVKLDAVQQLLLALTRAGVLDDQQRAALHARYLRQVG